MKRNLVILGLAAWVVLGAAAGGKPAKKSQPKLPLGSPIAADATVARLTATEVDAIFQSERNLRTRMLAKRFFAKPLSEQSTSVKQIIEYLSVDPLHGLVPRFNIDNDKNLKAEADYLAWRRYMVDGGVRDNLAKLLGKAQSILFDHPAQMIAQAEFYKAVGGEASAGLRIFDEMMYKLASGAPAFKRDHFGEEHLTWKDLLDYCKIDITTFQYYFYTQGSTGRLTIEPYFLNQLTAVKQHGDALPPAKVKEWADAAQKFLDEDLVNFAGMLQKATEKAAGNDRVLALREQDDYVVKAMREILEGMVSIHKQYEDPNLAPCKLRTGKGLYKYTKSRYALPDMPTDKVPDHVFLLNRMLMRFQSDMQGWNVRMSGISEKQRRQAAALRKKNRPTD